jgi:hypothetical protein
MWTWLNLKDFFFQINEWFVHKEDDGSKRITCDIILVACS